RLRTDWKVGGKTYPAGALLATSFEKYLKGDRNLEMLFTPAERKSLAATTATKNFLVVNELDNVKNRLYVLEHRNDGWTRTPLSAPDFGSVGMNGIDPEESDDYFMTVTDFLTPSSLYYGKVGET